MRSLILLLALFLLAGPGYAQYNIYANDGTYLGNTGNRYDPNSINNPYGVYGSRYSPQSVNNPNGQYGSHYSAVSPNDPYTMPATAVPVYGGLNQSFGGNASPGYQSSF